MVDLIYFWLVIVVFSFVVGVLVAFVMTRNK